MTDHNNAAQPGENLLDYAMAIAHERELDVTGRKHDSDGAVRRFKAAVERALLSKLRAEGVQAGDERAADDLAADERAANTPIKAAYVEHFGHAAGWLSYKGSWFIEGFQAGRRAALASAPVAGEAVRAALVELVECGKLQRDAQQAIWSGMSDRVQDGKRMQRQYEKRQPVALEAAISALDAASQASEAVRILFPTHLRKMWSGGEVQAWLDEHQGITPPKPSAKGSLERYRKWQTQQAEARNAALEEAAALFDGGGVPVVGSAQMLVVAGRIRALKYQAEKVGSQRPQGVRDER